MNSAKCHVLHNIACPLQLLHGIQFSGRFASVLGCSPWTFHTTVVNMGSYSHRRHKTNNHLVRCQQRGTEDNATTPANRR